MEKPAWYNEGPDNLDVLMDFEDMKIPQINDKAIYKIECSDTSKKGMIQCTINVADSNIKSNVLETFGKNTTSSIIPKQKQLKIHTLREIESSLGIHLHNQEHACDLSAFNKLLDIVGLRTNSRFDHETFRWYRAMANAASANAYIYQNIDSLSNFESEAQGSQDNSYFYLGYDTESRQSYEMHDYNNQEYFYRNKFGLPANSCTTNTANGLFNQIDLPNSGKGLACQSLQPFLLQQLLRQQQIAKYSAMRFLNLRNNGLGFALGFHSTRINTLYNSQSHPYNNTSNYNNYNVQFTQNNKLEQQEQDGYMVFSEVPTENGENKDVNGETPSTNLDPKSTEEFLSYSGEIAC
nr:hypothetical transcript [Hymenolepis microstoma]CDS34989.1 hypothetical transcript [Hymenolepis microstoma]